MLDVTVLGATGSVGRQTAEVIRSHPDHLRAMGLVGRSNVDEMTRQAELLCPRWIVMTDPEAAARVRVRMAGAVPVDGGPVALIDRLHDMDAGTAVVCAMSGLAGLRPALAAVEAGARLCLANKETLVAAGPLVRSLAKQHGASLLPVDSEHSALLQALGHPPRDYRRLWLTCTGGPFREWTVQQLERATLEQALSHPVWQMGPKNTLDSATLINKGLEMIEAHFLFDAPMDKIGVVIHPQGIVHSLVEFEDGAVLAQLATPDMRLPIQVALSWPDRWPGPTEPLPWQDAWQLTFGPPDEERFPALGIARRAGELGGTAPAVFNAADEVAVERFLKGSIRFPDIARLVADVLEAHRVEEAHDLAQVEAADRWARERGTSWR